ncbi:MAG: beta-N-acetylglucosaminidase domain-containing protein [Selenomonadaceae bacterium]|nr:beta-N-acetylglucosaminidase domain-containing protein [Selenomonadaceae bacterium]
MKKMIKRVTAALLMAGMIEGAAYAAPIPLRGVVEGFYGTPWTQKERMDMLSFMAHYDMNAYIYAPKDDPYHRELWREPYPAFEEKNLAKLIKFARENKIKFIFAVSPGLDLKYAGEAGEKDRKIMTEKLEAVYKLGARDFAIFFDDIEDKDGKGQADFLNYLTENFVKKHKDVSPLITVPTEYYALNMEENSVVKKYTKTFSETLDKSVLPLYTGRGVVCDSIPDIEYKAASRIYGRNLGIWWNYPVNDYMEEKLALGPVEDLPTESKVPAIFFNPMKFEESSKIAVGTGAIYAKNPKKYNPDKAYREVIKYKYKDLAKEMILVAAHSTHMENSWAKVGRVDGREFNEKTAALFEKLRLDEDAEKEFKAVEKELAALNKATNTLLKKLPKKDLREMEPQLKEMKELVELSENAVSMLKVYKHNGDYEEMLNGVISDYEEAVLRSETVTIADGSLGKFVRDAVLFVK